MNPRYILATTGIGIALLASACSGGDDESTPTAAATTAASTATQTVATSTATRTATSVATATAGAATSTATASATAAKKVSANNATIAELTAAFEAAGISNASRWAREVDEYRPYATTDTNLNKLRQELAKYNPGPGVVDAIVATLQLP